MPKIVYNNNEITDIHYSGYTIIKAYGCDGQLVYDSGYVPPTPTGKKLTYVVGGSEYSFNCDGSGVLGSDEIRFDLIRHDLKASGVTDVEIGTCVNTINTDAFNRYTSLSSVTIPNSVTTIGSDVFYECYSLSSITIPSSVTSIGYGTFDGCKNLQSINIPNGITTISEDCYHDCYRMLEVTIPSSVTSIESSAFGIGDDGDASDRIEAIYALSNREVYIYATTPPTIGINTFDSTIIGIDATYKIYVPSESVEAYKTSWSQYANRIQAIP